MTDSDPVFYVYWRELGMKTQRRPFETRAAAEEFARTLGWPASGNVTIVGPDDD